MTVLHSGTTKKYSNNWAQAFGEKSRGKSAAKASAKPAAKKKAAKKKK